MLTVDDSILFRAFLSCKALLMPVGVSELFPKNRKEAEFPVFSDKPMFFVPIPYCSERAGALQRTITLM